VSRQEELRMRATKKWRTARLARRLGPGLSVAGDRLSMLQYAEQLEVEAVRLEAEASIEAQPLPLVRRGNL
jgi:hypothetical protein